MAVVRLLRQPGTRLAGSLLICFTRGSPFESVCIAQTILNKDRPTGPLGRSRQTVTYRSETTRPQRRRAGQLTDGDLFQALSRLFSLPPFFTVVGLPLDGLAVRLSRRGRAYNSELPTLFFCSFPCHTVNAFLHYSSRWMQPQRSPSLFINSASRSLRGSSSSISTIENPGWLVAFDA